MKNKFKRNLKGFVIAYVVSFVIARIVAIKAEEQLQRDIDLLVLSGRLEYLEV